METNLEQTPEGYSMGDLQQFSSTQEPNREAIILAKEGIPTGYVIVGDEFYEVSCSHDHEGLRLVFSPTKLRLKTDPYQVTKEKPIHPQAIVKGDWSKSEDPIQILIEGDFRRHRKNIEDAVKEFKIKGESKLYLPSFL